LMYRNRTVYSLHTETPSKPNNDWVTIPAYILSCALVFVFVNPRRVLECSLLFLYLFV